MARPATGQVFERDGKRFALRFRALGRRWYITTEAQTREDAADELEYVLQQVKRGVWRPPERESEPAVPADVPNFHEYASRWVASRRHEVDERTIEYWEWALSSHLLPALATFRVSEITTTVVKRYRERKLAERDDPRGDRPLANGSINKTLKVLAQILDEAIEDGYIETNPARGKRTRLRATKPKRTWLELDEVRALLDAAGEHRALLATMILAGLRVGELCQLRWRCVDLARGRLTVEESKTDAGKRLIDVSPLLLDELKLHKTSARFSEPDDLVFSTRRGTRRDRSNVRSRVLAKAIERANAKLSKAGKPSIQGGVTNHTLRRTFASLLYEAGASPAYVMAQMGHESAALALEVYTKVMERKRETGERMDALVRGAEWAQMGTNGTNGDSPLSEVATGDAAEGLLQRD